MSKDKKQTKSTETVDDDKPAPPPLETIEIITSLWVLSLAFLTVGNLLMLIAYWVVTVYPKWITIIALYRVSVLGNVVISIISLIMLTIVLLRRPVAPPHPVTIYGVIFCLIPVAVAVKILIQ